MALTFNKMKPKKSYQHVVEEIQTAIFNGELGEGERLPPEMTLKDMFDTSRGTVREALRVLEQKGLVSIRPGAKGGARIEPANTLAMQDSMAVLIRHKKVSLAHLAQFRELLEGQAAEQAALAGDSQGLAELGDLLVKIRDHARTGPRDWNGFNELDARFHQILARMGGNPLIQANLKTIHENVHTYFQQFLPFSQALLETDIEDLAGILKAVEQGRAKAAGDLARRHVARFADLMAQDRKDEV